MQNDLRRKFLQAYEQGKETPGKLAEQFGVREGWAKKISATRTRTGQAATVATWPIEPDDSGVQDWLREQVLSSRI